MSLEIKEIQRYGFTVDSAILKALKTVESWNMIEKGSSVLISISGGPDSTFLTHLFYILRPALNLDIYGFCLDHMTRDGDSTKDSLFVKKMCGELDIKLFEKKVDVSEWCSSRNLSFQEGARLVRISNLLEISDKNNIDKIATGHNADDDIETSFINLFRGAGVKGLSGIKPVAGKFIRPLIEISRKDIESYLDREKIAYCVDRTNVQNIYFRNRIRNILIPFISRHFGESFKSNMLRALHILKSEDEFLSSYSLSRLEDIAQIRREGKAKEPVLIEIPAAKIAGEDISIRRRIVLSAIGMVNGSQEDISFKNVDDVLKILAPGGKSRVIQPGRRVKVCKVGSRIFFVNITNNKFFPDELEELLRKDSDLERDRRHTGKEMKVEIGAMMKLEGFGTGLSTELLKYNKDKMSLKDTGSMEAYIDYSKVKPPVKVRARKKGDKFYPLGMNGEKKLQDFFVDSKIPLHLRNIVPIFVDKEKIIWVGNYRIDDRVKVTDSTREVIHLKLNSNMI
jgi:tRNA(Ile)-lysidine synthase